MAWPGADGAASVAQRVAGAVGNLYIRAIDTNRSANEASLDTLYVDAMSVLTRGGEVQTPVVTVEATDANASEAGSDSGTFTIMKTADDNTPQTYALPSGLSGTVFIRVLDTNRAANKKTIDSLYIDELCIRCG